MTAERPTEDELRAFVGPKADYYIGIWQLALDGSRARPAFNVASFLLSGLWLPFRKMYLAATILLGGLLAESLLEDVLFVGILGMPSAPTILSRGVGIGAAVVCGMFGSQWYLSHARKQIASARSMGLPPDEHLRELARRGGTRWLASIGFLVVFLLAAFALTFFETLLGFGGRVEMSV